MKNLHNEFATAGMPNKGDLASAGMDEALALHHRHDRGYSSGIVKAALAVALVLSVLLIFLAVNVSNAGGLVANDLKFSASLQAARMPFLTHIMVGVSNLHSTVGILCLSAVLLAYMKRAKHTVWLKYWLLVVPLGMLANVAVKLIVHRPRPLTDNALVSVTSFSFPSGHTTTATVFYGLLGAYLIFLARSPAQRIAVVLLGIFLTALVAYSRIYLGAHYLSDVLASLLLGSTWLCLCVAMITIAKQRQTKRAV